MNPMKNDREIHQILINTKNKEKSKPGERKYYRN